MRSTPHTSRSVARQLGACMSAAFSTLQRVQRGISVALRCLAVFGGPACSMSCKQPPPVTCTHAHWQAHPRPPQPPAHL